MFGIPQKIPTSIKNIVIEDCAQSLGARIGQVPAGLQGELGVYSFYATKVMTSGGQGGMIVSQNRAYIDWIKDFRQFDARTDRRQRFNFQMTDLQAAIGREQLKKLPQFLARREEIFEQYKEAGIPLVDVNPQLHPIRFRALVKTKKQQALIQALRRENIHAVIPITEEELVGKGHENERQNSMDWANYLISLPIFPKLTDREVKRVIATVLQVI